jgi:transketolase
MDMEIVYNGQKDPRNFKDVIGATMGQLLKEDPDVAWLDADLMSCSSTNKLPTEDGRVINCGIAEANMAGIAAGMSAAGMKPYIHTFGPFASRRCYDQVFLSAGYAQNPITVVGTDPGITAAFNGGTHMPFEDVALYRALPNATIIDITDVPMLVDVLKQAKDLPGVKYIRVPRKESYPVYAEGSHFTVGKANVVREGKDAVIIACGIMVHEAMQAAEMLEKQGISAAVIDVFTIKPLDVELVRAYAEKTGVVVTAENHNKIGGLTSAVQDAVCGMALKFGYVAVEDEFGEVGPQDYLRKRFDLTCDHIARKVQELLK